MDDKKLIEYKNRSTDWLRSTVVSRTYPPSFSHSRRKIHGGIKPPELCLELIYAFGQNAHKILDPFAGVGSTLIASSLANKSALGIELNPIWKELYYQVCDENNLSKQQYLVGDSSEILTNMSDKFDFVLTDVPYFSMDKLKKTRGKFSRAGEETKSKLPSSLKLFNKEPIQSYESWLQLIKIVFSQVFTIIKPSTYVLIFIGNMYRNLEVVKSQKKQKIGKYYMLAADLASTLIKIGYTHVTELIWMDTGKKLGIYGYPFVWIPSIVDQRILVMQKLYD